jgi:hypothetical protein
MLKQLMSGLLLTILIATGTYYLFEAVQIPLAEPVGNAAGEPALVAELIFLAVGFFLYLFLVKFRLLALLSLQIGQLSLFLQEPTVLVLGREFPIYGLAAINGVVFLLFYFMFSTHLWAPDELDPEDMDPG